MTQAQSEAQLCGVTLEDHDPRFVAQHMAAYVFVKPLASGKRVLEVGFGSGYGTCFLAEAAQEIIGIDMAPGNIPRASAQYQRSNLHFERMDATALTFPDRSFDLVCSFQVIEHIPEQLLPRYLSEISRVLRPDGTFCVSTLNLAHNMKPGKPYEKLIYHEKEFTASELEKLLKQAFPSVELRGLHLTRRHWCYQRLKRWGLNRLGPRACNPIARFYDGASAKDFRVSCHVSRSTLDLIALCRKSASCRS